MSVLVDMSSIVRLYFPSRFEIFALKPSLPMECSCFDILKAWRASVDSGWAFKCNIVKYSLINGYFQRVSAKLSSTGKVASSSVCSEESLAEAEVDLFNWACVPTIEVCFCISSPYFTVVGEDWDNHTVRFSKLAGVVMSVYLLMPKNECVALSRSCSWVMVKFPVGDNLTPRYVYSWVDSIGWPFRKNVTFGGFRTFFWKIIVLVFLRLTVIFQSKGLKLI